MSPAASASRSAEVNTPTPICATGSDVLSPAVAIVTISTAAPAASSASAINRVCASASALPRVPIRKMFFTSHHPHG